MLPLESSRVAVLGEGRQLKQADGFAEHLWQGEEQ